MQHTNICESHLPLSHFTNSSRAPKHKIHIPLSLSHYPSLHSTFLLSNYQASSSTNYHNQKIKQQNLNIFIKHISPKCPTSPQFFPYQTLNTSVTMVSTLKSTIFRYLFLSIAYFNLKQKKILHFYSSFYNRY